MRWTNFFEQVGLPDNKEVRSAKMTLIGGAVVYWNDIENFALDCTSLPLLMGKE